MRLVLHIVWKDFLRLRWGLVTWWALLAGKMAIGFALIFYVGDAQSPESGHGAGWWSDEQLLPILFAIAAIERALAFFLTALLVQEDPLVGTSPFWMTRPISGARLLAGKMVGWGLMLWLSGVVLTLPWWLTCGFGPIEIARAALELLALQAVVSLQAALVASLTDTLGRVIVWSLVLVAAVSLSTPMLIAAIEPHGASAAEFPNISGLALVSLALVGVGTIVRQYISRSWLTSLRLLAIGVVAGPVFVGCVGVNFGSNILRLVNAGARWTDWHAERAQGVELRMHSFYATAASAKERLQEKPFITYLAASGVPPGQSLTQGGNAQQTWRWPSGLVLKRDDSWFDTWGGVPSMRLALGVKEAESDEETELYERKLDDERASRQSAEHRASTRRTGDRLRTVPDGVILQAWVLPSSIARVKQTPPAYAATVQLRLVQPEPWIEVPFALSGWHARAGFGFRLGERIPRHRIEARQSKSFDRELDNAPDTVAFPIVATMPSFLWDLIFSERSWLQNRWKQPSLYVVNRAGGDLLGQNVYRSPRVMIAGVGILRDTVRALTPALRRGDRWVARDPRWLEEAKFVLVGVREEARFTREVRAERFEAANRANLDVTNAPESARSRP